MLERSGGIAYHECDGKYRQVRRLIEETTQDPACQARIYQVLFQYGGRCDCTVDRNVVRVSGHLEAAEEEIRQILAGGNPG